MRILRISQCVSGQFGKEYREDSEKRGKAVYRCKLIGIKGNKCEGIMIIA